MTETPSPSTAPPLHTDADVRRRVETLIGPAAQDHTLWLLFVDGDRRQSPVVVPIEELPRLPDATVGNLGRILDEILPTLATGAGPGSVVFVRERLGPGFVMPDDRVWAEVLRTMCRARGIAHRGVYLSSPGGVRALE